MFPNRFTSGTAVLVAITLFTAGCDTEPSPEGRPSTSPSQAAGPSRLPSGITWYDELDGTVGVFDPSNGRVLHQAAVSGGEHPGRLTVAPGGTTAVGLRRCKLQVYRWTGQTFALEKEHPQPAGLCFDHATFREGRFRIETTRDPDSKVTDTNPWFTLDPAAAQTLRQEEPVAAIHPAKLTMTGRSGTGTVQLSGLRVTAADLREVSGPRFRYFCKQAIDDIRFFCVASSDEQDADKTQPFGVLAIATFDLKTQAVVSLEQVMPASQTFVYAAALSPDGKDFIIRTTSGQWQRLARDGSHTPVPIRGEPMGESPDWDIHWL
ncbi:hypothetical protein [Dactylosporangium sp. NPDC006015]|uniref:hypothetical protein n=1 Tax=Dactylosporangium sp. NPDC006015 TaxID=3154576 RepID=UPI0033BC168E